jgi:hypothetical protein
LIGVAVAYIRPMETDPTAPDPTALEPTLTEDPVDVDGDAAVREVRAPSTDALNQLEADLAELEAELAALEADDGGEG